MNTVKCCSCPDCDGNSIYECTHKEEWEIALRRAKIGEAWEADSSLEKWFPFTAEELTTLRNIKQAALALIEFSNPRTTKAIEYWRAVETIKGKAS